MPFTPAHPAIVLPLLKVKRASATAFVIGSLAPDFEYFFKMSVSGKHGHTLFGIFYFDIPVTIGLAFLFHCYVKTNLINNLPVFIQQRFHAVRQLDFVVYFKKHWLAFLICAAAGSFLHIFWDSFTHGTGFFVQQFPSLRKVRIPFDGVRYPLFYALQHISTFAGLTILGSYIYLMKADKETKVVKPSLLYWLVLLLVTSLILFLRFTWFPKSFNLGNAVVTCISGLCISLLVAGQLKFTRQLTHKTI
jgi:hypothetical protein